MLTWLIRIVLLAALVIGSLVGIILIAEPELHLTPYRDTLSQRLSGLLGRDMMFNGDVELKLGRHAALQLSQVHLANAEWAENKTLLSAGQISAGIDLLALMSGNVHLEGVVLRDVDIALEESADGNASWSFVNTSDDASPGRGDDHRFSLIIEDALIEQARVQYRSPERAEPLALTIERLSQYQRESMLMLDGKGTINRSNITLAGQVGSLDALLAGRDINLDLSTSVDDTVMRLRGRLGDPARLEDIDLEGGIRGPNLADLLAVFGIDYAAGGNIDTHLVIEDHDPGLKASMIGHIGAMQIDARGVVGKPTAFDDVALDVAISGKDLSTLGVLLGVRDLPVEPYSLKGHLQRKTGRLHITDVVATSGDSKAELSAELPAFPAMSGGTATATADLPTLRPYAKAIGIENLPAGPLSANLNLTPATGGDSQLKAKLVLAGDNLTLEGLVGRHPEYRGTRLAFGLDVANANALAGLKQNRPIPLTLRGDLLVDDQRRLQLMLPNGRLGEAKLAIAGDLGQLPEMTGTDLSIKASGKSLQSFASSFTETYLPPHPFLFEARLQGDITNLNVSSTQTRVGEMTLRSKGPIGPLPSLQDTNARLEVDIPGIGQLMRDPPQAAWTKANYRAKGQLVMHQNLIQLKNAVIEGDRIDARFSAQISDKLSPESVRVELQVDTPSLSDVLPPVRGYVPPDAPLSAAIALQPRNQGLQIRKLDLKVADATLTGSGFLGLGGNENTTMKFLAKGPSLAQLGQFDDAILVDNPFEISATVRQEVNRSSIDDLMFIVGDTELTGRIDVRPGEVPTVDIDLNSRRGAFDILIASPDIASGNGESKTPETTGRAARAIPETTINLDALDQVNGRLRLTAENVDFPDPVFPDSMIVRSLNLDVTLRDSRLLLEKLQVDGDRGRVKLSGGMERQGEQAGVNLTFQASDFRFDILSAGSGLAALPQHEVSVNLAAVGQTYRSLARSLNGSIRIEGGSGRTNNTRTNQTLGRFTNDLISTLNPFRKTEAQTRIDCSAVAASIQDGVLKLFPGGVVRTDKLDIAASGTINLDTERLDIHFRSMPRKGLGISVAGIVHPYVKVSGTLSRPGMTLDTPTALLSGTAAVATGGLSILATRLLDRASGVNDLCAEIMSKAGSGKARSTLNPINILGDAINRRAAPDRPSLSNDD